MVLLNHSNISFPPMSRNEVTLSINVLDEHSYAMSPELALSLAAMLESEARKVLKHQGEALKRFETRPR